ncbi:MAG: hypothetical protein ACQES0_02940 [Bacteroidota bacterium]
MKKIILPVLLMLILPVSNLVQGQEMRREVSTGEGLPSFFPYLGLEYSRAKVIRSDVYFKFAMGAQYYYNDDWTFFADYGIDFVERKTDIASRRQNLRIGTSHLLAGGLKTKDVDEHYKNSKFRGLNVKGGLDYRVDLLVKYASNAQYDDDLFGVPLQSFGITSFFIGLEFMHRKVTNYVNWNYSRGISIKKYGWNQHLSVDLTFFSFSNKTNFRIYNDWDDYLDDSQNYEIKKLIGNDYDTMYKLRRTGIRLGYYLTRFISKGSSHRIGFEVGYHPFIEKKYVIEDMPMGSYINIHYTSALPLF